MIRRCRAVPIAGMDEEREDAPLDSAPRGAAVVAKGVDWKEGVTPNYSKGHNVTATG